MVVKRQCSFCASEIEPGTGTMYVKRDGTVFHFCSSSCRKQQLHLGRVGHRFKWTRAHALKVSADRAGAAKPSAAPAPAPRVSGKRPSPKARKPPSELPAAPPSEAAPARATTGAAAPPPEGATPPAPEAPPAESAPPKRPRARKKSAAPRE
jgi:large subunit ribosomal protein L24e